MDKEKLKQVAGYYFYDQMGMEPDTLFINNTNDGMKKYNIRATAGSRRFDIYISGLCNVVRLVEIHNVGTLKDAAELAGYDRNLEPLVQE